MVVLAIVRLRHASLRPLYQSKLVNREVAAQWHYVSESMALFLFFFVQLAVMATYISQDLMKLVPLLTIVFVFGRYVASAVWKDRRGSAALTVPTVAPDRDVRLEE